VKKKGGDDSFSKMIRDAGMQVKLDLKNQIDSVDLDHPEIVIPDGPFQPKVFNILDYIEQPWGLNMTLYPVQRFVVKLYYHLPLDDKNKTITVTDMLGDQVRYRFTETEYLKFLNSEGRCNIGEQDHPRNELVMSVGRRGGKTMLSSIFASYEIYRLLNLGNPQSYYGFPNGDRIQIISVAVDKEQAGILFGAVSGHLQKCDYFRPYMANSTQSLIQFRTPWDIEKFGPVDRLHQNGRFTTLVGKASLRVTFKSSVAKGLRGHSNAVIIMDEVAHYTEDGTSSAKDIYDAIFPSSATYVPKDPETKMPYRKADGNTYPLESRVISISSPLNKSGHFYNLYMRAMRGGPDSTNMIAIKAPTWELNPSVPADYYKQKYYEDPLVFMTEHGADFSDRVRGWIEREADLMACVDPEARPHYSGVTRFPHQMGVDIGLVNDASVVCITAVVQGKVQLVYHEKWQAGVDWRDSNPHLGDQYSVPYCKLIKDAERLEFDEIANWIFALTKRFYITDGLFDRFTGIPLEQALLKKGLSQFRCEYFSRDQASKIYQNAKLAMFDKGLVLYDYPLPDGPGISGSAGSKHSPHIQELLSLQAQQMSKNVVIVEAPEGRDNHDDFSDAFVRAVFLSSDILHNTKKVYGHSIASGYGAVSAPSGGGMSPQRYERMRARHHGVHTERRNPMAGSRMRSRRGF